MATQELANKGVSVCMLKWRSNLCETQRPHELPVETDPEDTLKGILTKGVAHHGEGPL